MLIKLGTPTDNIKEVAHDIIEEVVSRCGVKEKYWVCRVYPNEETNWGERTRGELLEFITYNHVMRFGCALIIEGVCYYTGYFQVEEISELEEWITEFYNLDIKKDIKKWCQVVSKKDEKAYYTHAYKPCRDFMKQHNLSRDEYKIVHIDSTREKVELPVCK